ncbi:MAG: hypothetical protein EB072_14435 [Betaproteobacteria bacterium]|nr:hypothetical protein [Betaproteobacteria bacterium]
MRNALYPCCGTDFEIPSTLLRSYADTVIFCDTNKRNRQKFKDWHADSSSAILIQTNFECIDVWDFLGTCSKLSAFFYRRDSSGEGGSGVPVFSDEFLEVLMAKFEDTGYILSDGSNSVGGMFRAMIRISGLDRFGFRFRTVKEQPLLENFGLYLVKVERLLV